MLAQSPGKNVSNLTYKLNIDEVLVQQPMRRPHVHFGTEESPRNRTQVDYHVPSSKKIVDNP